ncbi:unnamed protein product [Brassica oleracea]
MDYTSGSNRLCRSQANEAEFFFHLIRNQRLPSSRGTSSVFLGNNGLNDVENYELPRLVYVLVRREPRSDHHKKVEEINLLYSVEDMTLWGSIKWS